MPKIIAAFAILLVAACGNPSTSQAPRAITAALSYADWCSSCKMLDPKLAAVRQNHALEGITFVTLDYTERDSGAFFMAADNAGIGEAVSSHFAAEVKTGLLLLVDPATQEVVSVINKTMSETEILSALTAATAG
ncbi:MAG: thioredoxin domain-containing protein [Pseudomonadota bacterium]